MRVKSKCHENLTIFLLLYQNFDNTKGHDELAKWIDLHDLLWFWSVVCSTAFIECFFCPFPDYFLNIELLLEKTKLWKLYETNENAFSP